ncbi:H-type small acid-soluble spore protein [Desertibacillus haloalkaliphilus]|uniref:H-type small acid-soluble spore protein n=1 Tax=Desertibacillus haloalkaliphilus TaxID=1328930 RepID=UPI001C27FC34|nr:H-type small acid-soluble spore protein [Desertibacillus haloalkaliphilus]MBU8908571.1 H-type small acid-soluble spore protein [Desertibacillus haloalkaliphilus]
MEPNRAKQIISSPKEITVTYHGVPVWLKNVNESEGSVSAFSEENSDEVMVLPLEELEEE